jgi:hypothetical protein
VDRHPCRPTQERQLHSLNNNSLTSEGWLRKTNFIEDDKDPTKATIRLKIAHRHASQYLSNGIYKYSQWFPGAANKVADSLSQNDNHSDKELTPILCSLYPSQLPQHVEIVPLPNEITSWLILLLLWLPVKQQLMETHSKTKLGCGDNTQSTVNLAASKTTSSSTERHITKRLKSWQILLLLCTKGDFQDLVMLPWLKAQSAVALNLWLQPSRRTDEKTQNKTHNIMLHDFYSGN